MLESIQNLSVKSWVNYCGPDGHFSRVNLLFGQNGQGKSALAAGIRSEVIHSVDSAEAVRFFDRDYVQREMSLVETDGIKGVKVDFGKQNTVSE